MRAWLRRSRLSAEDIDELIQDCYCRFSMLDGIDHIERPRGYFFATARSLLVRQLSRAKIVSIEAYAEIDELGDATFPSPEQAAGSRLDYLRMLRFIADLPERCRTIVELRKIEGWSQKEIAAHLGVTEKVVEKQVWLGVRAIMRAWQSEELAVDRRLVAFEEGGTADDAA